MNLSDGISFVLVVMATFAMSEALMIIFKLTIRPKLQNRFHYLNCPIKLDKDETKKWLKQFQDLQFWIYNWGFTGAGSPIASFWLTEWREIL